MNPDDRVVLLRAAEPWRIPAGTRATVVRLLDSKLDGANDYCTLRTDVGAGQDALVAGNLITVLLRNVRLLSPLEHLAECAS